MKTVRIITPTGHLGTTPLEKASFERGCACSWGGGHEDGAKGAGC